MGKRKEKKNWGKGSASPQSISRGIEKRSNRHQTSQVPRAPIFTQGNDFAPPYADGPPFPPTNAQPRAFAPPYPNGPPFPPTTTQPRAFAPPYPHGPSFPPAVPQPHAFAPSYPSAAPLAPVPLHASCNSALLQEEDMSREDELSGYIFMCNGETKTDCYKYRVLALPASRIDVVEKIKPGMKLFLFDFDAKLLYGIYVAASKGVMALEPTAFGGRYPAQVRFEIFKDCLPLPESDFKHVITYQVGPKFKQDLSGKQVRDLISLFRPIAAPLPAHVVSLERTAAAPRRIEPPNVEEWSRPAVEISASYDQYLAGLHPGQRGQERYYGHGEQISAPYPHVPDASTTRIQPMHLQQVVSQPKPEPYYAAAAQQTYHPDIPSLAPLELYRRYAAMRRDDEVIRGPREPQHAIAASQGSNPLPAGHAQLNLSAAFWASVASGDPNREFSGRHHQLQESANSGSRVENVPNTAYSSVPGHNPHHVIPQANTGTSGEYYPNVVVSGNYAPIQPHDQMASQPVGPTHVPSSSQTAAYWTGVAYQDPNPQATPSGDVGLGVGGTVPVMHSIAES